MVSLGFASTAIKVIGLIFRISNALDVRLAEEKIRLFT
jgi:hypothetical protein